MTRRNIWNIKEVLFVIKSVTHYGGNFPLRMQFHVKLSLTILLKKTSTYLLLNLRTILKRLN